MGIILFLVDTSASMNQRTYLGTSYLDVAKVAIDTFMKYRARDPGSRYDRYMLVTFDDPPNAIKAGWKENHATFITELKSLTATGLSSFGSSLREALDLLNIHRLHTGIDHYGQGRNPFFLEPAVIIALSDGTKLNKNGVQVDEELSIPVEPRIDGHELVQKLYRWDQRLFTVLLQLPGLLNGGGRDVGEKEPSAVHKSISSLCEATGGKCYTAVNSKSLSQCVESLAQKLHPGVVVNLRRRGVGADNGQLKEYERVSPVDSDHNNGGGKEDTRSTAWHNTRRMIYVRPNPKTNIPTGHWPIPESFWPNSSMTVLPARDVHPVIWFDTEECNPKLIENFAFDKYELEPSPLTQRILERRMPGNCWQVFSDDKRDGEVKCPFGYLKASSSGNFVNLFIMPYNYPVLLLLIEELQRQQLRPSNKWRLELTDYISAIPSYYVQPLRKALQLMGAHPGLVPDSMDSQLSYSITSYLRKLKKQAKLESEKLMVMVARNKTTNGSNSNGHERTGIVDLGSGISVAIGSTRTNGVISSQSFRNPFDIPRGSLLGQITRMRTNFFHTSSNIPNLIEEVTKHQIPIGQMGNYQEHLKRINPLREVDSGSVKTQLFGNPFKLEKASDKKGGIDAALADEVLAERVLGERSRRSGTPGSRRRSLSPAPSPPPLTSNSKTSTGNDVQENQKRRPSKISPPPIPAAKSTTVAESYKDASTEVVATQVNDQVSVDVPTNPATASDPVTDVVAKVSTGSDHNEMNETPHNDLLATAKEPFRAQSQTAVSRKRTPSPTMHLAPPAKRPTLESTLSSSKRLNADMNLKPANSKTANPLLGALTNRLGSTASRVLTEEFQRKQGQENSKLKQLIIKEIRKPGKNFDAIFQSLDKVQGSHDVKRVFAQDLITHAEKFRKKQLVESLREWAGSSSKTTPLEKSRNKLNPK